MQIDYDLLALITKTPGAPGFENAIRKTIYKEIVSYCDQVYTDPMGNLVTVIKGKSRKKIMVAAHMDEIAFIVNHIDESGYVRFVPLGGFDPKSLFAQRVIIHGKEKSIYGVMGSMPIHVLTAEDKLKTPTLDDFYIDTGYSKKELETIIQLGNPITRYSELLTLGDCINSKSLDNRISVYIAIETVKKLHKKPLPFDVYIVFTVQEELGLRGATAVSSGINPDFGLVLDVTMANDLPNIKDEKKVTELGKGCAIKVLDGSFVSDTRIVKFLTKTAKESGTDYQLELLPAGGTDGAAMQKFSNGGCITGGLSIPTRYLHQSIEMVNSHDVICTIELLTQALCNFNNFDFDYG